jgi:DNA polymerase III subunit epsilon
MTGFILLPFAGLIIWLIWQQVRPKPVTAAATAIKPTQAAASYVSLRERMADYNEIVAERGFIALDTQTTGLSVREDGIITLAAIHIHGNQELARLHLCFNPRASSHLQARDLHGWLDKDLAIQPTIRGYADEIAKFLSRSPIWVGHNIAFDMEFLGHAAPGLDKLVRAAKPVCTLELAREVLPSISNRKLDTCLLYYDLKRTGRYPNALEDVALTAKLAFHLLELPPPDIDIGDAQPANIIRPLPSGRKFPTAPTPK